MAEGRLTVLILPPNAPAPPAPPPPVPAQVHQPQHQQQQHHHPQVMLNWPYFKPEFSGKPEKDVEAHLLCTNDWMNTYNFPEAVKVERFCLTLSGQARLCYASLEPIAVDWNGLQDKFR